MSEKFPKLKLKRKKPLLSNPSLESYGVYTENISKSTTRLPQETQWKGVRETCCRETESWWNKTNLQDPERLWALTLKASLPKLDEGAWDPVPDLPEALAVTPRKDDFGWKWCSLDDEVCALPVHLKLTKTPPGELGVCSSNDQLHPAESGSISFKAGCTDVARQSLHMQDLDLGSLCTQAGVLEHVGSSNRDVPEECPRVNDGEKRTGTTMESCPMCTMPFPAGFTQMDCDEHLAKCLSVMNEDIAW